MIRSHEMLIADLRSDQRDLMAEQKDMVKELHRVCTRLTRVSLLVAIYVVGKTATELLGVTLP